MERIYAIVLAAGNGSRMGGDIAKQYRLLGGKPVLCHTLAAFEQSVVDAVVLVVQAGAEEYAQTQIVRKYGFCKVAAVIVGGSQRCDSVYAGMRYIMEACGESGREAWIVLVHDGARPFVTPELAERMADAAKKNGCAVPAVPVKDTIKQVRDGFAAGTLQREELYAVQTPQAFRAGLLWEAFGKYGQLAAQGDTCGQLLGITDDAVLVERMLGMKAAVVDGDYRNIKLTTPDDMIVARAFLMEAEKTCLEKNKKSP
ncbi:MAG: 2-C-methyl-D-erythritol 4-phosphate cytidylyltransferase [Lachnospiraceae bacterium]|nr:2-C-methyl-D-erythritol 4-phosphate cytidylyltransferase [Lachnospiraceae bacterium]